MAVFCTTLGLTHLLCRADNGFLDNGKPLFLPLSEKNTHYEDQNNGENNGKCRRHCFFLKKMKTMASIVFGREDNGKLDALQTNY